MLKSLVFASMSALAFGQSLTDVLGGNSDLSQLVGLIKGQPQLLTALGSAQNITVLAPNNAALGALLNSSGAAALQSNPAAISALLQYHVLNGTIFASQITNKPAFAPSLLTDPMYSNVTGGQRVEAVTANGGVSIISGLLNNSTVVQANQNFTGGTVHVINRVLTVPANVSTTLVTAGLSSLYGALTKANLLGAADGLRDVTIFAPSNSGFQAIGSAAANLTSDQLAGIITYHVHNGSRPIYSTGLSDGQMLTTMAGTNVTIHIQNGTVFVNGAKVVQPDVLVAGGVVHVIDNVLNPMNATAAPGSGATSGSPAFSGASSVSTAPFTSGVPTASMSLGSGGSATATSTSSSSSSSGAAMPMRTGAIGAAALFGAGAVFVNL